MMKIAVLAAVAGLAAAQEPMCNNVVLKGYSKPYCNQRVAAGARIVTANIQNIKPSNPFVNGNPKTYNTDSATLLARHTSKSTGFVYSLPTELEYGTPKYNDWDPSHPEHCAKLCDLSDECNGFTFKYAICWLFGSNANTKVVPKGKWTTYLKTSSAIRKGTAAITAPQLFDNGAAVNPNKASADCDALYSLGEPCTLDAVSGTSTGMANNDFTSLAGMSTSLTLSDGSQWLGAAPSVFDSSLVSTGASGLVLSTRHSTPGSFSFPAPDEDCGCDYETYRTSMAAGTTAVGYGYYEATFKSTAGEFLNAFWLQGPTSEINVLKVENNVATISWYCFDDQNSQTSDSVTVSGVDISKDTTATLHYTAEQITVLINGEIKYQVVTDACLKGKTMKPIFSVEVGDNLPSTTGVANGASFGAMTVSYFRTWSSNFLLHRNKDGGVACASDPATGKLYGGLYKGPVPPGRWQATCGQRLIGKRKFKSSGGKTIVECGQMCIAYPGCVGFWWALSENNKCRLYGDFVPQALDDVSLDDDAQGNIWMRMSEGVPKAALTCDGATAGTFNDFTEECHNAPGAFGPRASIDIDGDDRIDYGCPYDKSEFVNRNNERSPKQCKPKNFVTAQGRDVSPGVSPSSLSGNAQGYIQAARWIKEGEHTRAWGSRGVLGPMTPDLCVQLCREECSCRAASWRFDKNHCWLMSTEYTNAYKNQAKPPPTAPIRMLKYAHYEKRNPSGCDINALKARGVMSL